MLKNIFNQHINLSWLFGVIKSIDYTCPPSKCALSEIEEKCNGEEPVPRKRCASTELALTFRFSIYGKLL